MLPLATLKVLLVVPILLVAAAFLGAGARILLRSRPWVIRASLPVWLIVVSMLPILAVVASLAASARQPALACFVSFPIVLFAFILASVRRTATGYLILGVTEGSFRASMRAALAAVGLPFEETVLGFVLPSLRDTLQARIEPRLGTAQFRLKGPGHTQTLEQIAQHVRAHLERDAASLSIGSAALYGAIGVMLLGLAFYQAQRF